MKKIFICAKSKTVELKTQEGMQMVDSVMEADEVVCAGQITKEMRQQLLTARMVNIPVRFLSDNA